jgi:hypothetical protein
MNPNCAVFNPMTQMIRLFAPASTQPSQHLLPTRIVEITVGTHDKQSSRNASESTSIIRYFPADRELVRRSRMQERNLGNLSFRIRYGDGSSLQLPGTAVVYRLSGSELL